MGITMHETMQVDEQYTCICVHEEEGTGEVVMVMEVAAEMVMDEAAKREASHFMPPFRTTTGVTEDMSSFEFV